MATSNCSAIPEALLPHLEPEWVELWNNHGRLKKRADEVDIATFRQDPSAYSFTYANDVDKFYHDELMASVGLPLTNGAVRP